MSDPVSDRTDADADANTATTGAGDAAPSGRTVRIIVQIVGWLVCLGLLYWTFFVLLPGMVDPDEVRAALAGLTPGWIAALTVTGLTTVVAVGWTATTVLPGLRIWQGTEASATGQLTAVVIPPPGDLLIRFAMYRTYGFSDDRSAIAVTLSGIARYATVVAMPVLGLALVLLVGQGGPDAAQWFVILTAVLVLGLWLVLRVINSTAFAEKVGRILDRVVTWLITFFRRTPPTDLERSVIDFGARMRDVVAQQTRAVAVSNIAWGLACSVVMLVAMRASGLDGGELSVAQVVLITGANLLLSSVPFIPGGVGFTEAVLLSVVTFADPADQASFAAGLLLYRLFTWLLPLPIGAITFTTWRARVRRQGLSLRRA